MNKWHVLALIIFLITGAECQEPGGDAVITGAESEATRKYENGLFQSETGGTTIADINTTVRTTEIENNSTTVSTPENDGHDDDDEIGTSTLSDNNNKDLSTSTLQDEPQKTTTDEIKDQEGEDEAGITEWTTLPSTSNENLISVKDVFEKSLNVVKDKGIGVLQDWLKEEAKQVMTLDLGATTPDYSYTDGVDEYTDENDVYDEENEEDPKEEVTKLDVDESLKEDEETIKNSATTPFVPEENDEDDIGDEEEITPEIVGNEAGDISNEEEMKVQSVEDETIDKEEENNVDDTGNEEEKKVQTVEEDITPETDDKQEGNEADEEEIRPETVDMEEDNENLKETSTIVEILENNEENLKETSTIATISENNNSKKETNDENDSLKKDNVQEEIQTDHETEETSTTFENNEIEKLSTKQETEATTESSTTVQEFEEHSTSMTLATTINDIEDSGTKQIHEEDSEIGKTTLKPVINETTDIIDIIEEDFSILKEIQENQDKENEKRDELVKDIEEKLTILEEEEFKKSSTESTTEIIFDKTTIFIGTDIDDDSLNEDLESSTTEFAVPNTSSEITTTVFEEETDSKVSTENIVTTQMIETSTNDKTTLATDTSTISLNEDTTLINTEKTTIEIFDEVTDEDSTDEQETEEEEQRTTQNEETSTSFVPLSTILDSEDTFTTNEEFMLVSEDTELPESNDSLTTPVITNPYDIVDEIIDEVIDEIKELEAEDTQTTTSTTENVVKILVEESVNLTKTLDKILTENEKVIEILTSNTINVLEDKHLSEDKPEDSNESTLKDEDGNELDKEVILKSVEEEYLITENFDEKTENVGETLSEEENVTEVDEESHEDEGHEEEAVRDISEPSVSAVIRDNHNGFVCLNASGLSIKITRNSISNFVPTSARRLGECTSFGAILNFTWKSITDIGKNDSVRLKFVGDEEEAFLEEAMLQINNDVFVASEMELYLSDPMVIALSKEITLTISHPSVQIRRVVGKRDDYDTEPILSADNTLAIQIAAGGLCAFMVIIAAIVFIYKRVRSDTRIFKVSLDK